MKTSLTSLYATCCALLIFLSPAHGQPCNAPVSLAECIAECAGELPACVVPGLTIPEDDTCYLRCLIENPDAPLNARNQRQVTICPKDGIPGRVYTTHPLRLPCDLELTLAAGVVIQDTDNVFTCLFGQPTDPQHPCDSPSPWADHNDPDAPGANGKFNELFLAKGIENLTIIGEGEGTNRATLRMRGAAGVAGPPTMNEYPTCSEFVHALALIDVTNVEVSNLNIQNTGGDGIIIWNGDIVNVHGCTIDNANRNGISIISGTDITIEDCTLKNTTGTSPQAGMDLEPDDASDNDLVRIRIKRCTAEGNALRGFFVNLAEINQNSAPVDVLFEDCVVNGTLVTDPTAAGLYGGYQVWGDDDDINGGGTIEFINCSAIDPGLSPELLLLNHLNLDWDLRSPIKIKFRGLNLVDNRDDNNKLIKIAVRGRQQDPQQRLSDRIDIKGIVTGSSNDPVIEVVPNPGVPGAPYSEISGCLAAPGFTDGDAAQTNLSVSHVTSFCGNGTPEACEECDCDDDFLFCYLPPNGDTCDHCFIVPHSGLRITLNATAFPNDPHVGKWSSSPVCVDLRADDPLCNLDKGSSTYDPNPCRTFTYYSDLQADEDEMDRLVTAEQTFNTTIGRAEEANEEIVIGTYISGARVQWQWDSFPIEAVSKAAVEARGTNTTGWFVEGGIDQPHRDYVNIDGQDGLARAALAAEIVKEYEGDANDPLNYPGVNRPILYLDNIVHPSQGGTNAFNWTNRMLLLDAVRSGIAPADLLVNVAVATYAFPALDRADLKDSVEGVSFELPLHPNARAIQANCDATCVEARVNATIDAHRELLDAGLTVIFASITDNTSEESTSIERKLMAGFAMCLYEPGDKLFVVLPFFLPSMPPEEWFNWDTDHGAPVPDARHVFFDENSDLIITRHFQDAILKVNVTDKTVVWEAAVIHAQWDQPGSQPVEGADYFVVTTGTGAPDVQLRTPRGDWRIWSADGDESMGIGDIGRVSIVPDAPTGNFTLKLERPDGAAGARNVMGITLLPTGAASYSNLAGEITGNLGSGGLVLQGTPGTSGAASLTILGNISGDINNPTVIHIPTADSLQVNGAVYPGSTITIGGFAGTSMASFLQDFAGVLSLPYGIPQGATVLMMGHLADSGHISFGGALAGVLTFLGGSAPQSQIHIGSLTETAHLNLLNLIATYAGTLTLADIQENGSIYLGGATFDSLIDIGGNCAGSIYGFGTFNPNGFLSIEGNLTQSGFLNLSPLSGEMLGAIHITGDSEGTIVIDDPSNFGLEDGIMSGALYVDGLMNGYICASNIGPDQPLPSNLHLAKIGPQGSICGTPVCASAAVAADPTGINKTRFISFRTDDTEARAIAVRLTSLHHVEPPYNGGPSIPFTSLEGQYRYVGTPVQYVESGANGTTFWAAPLQSTPNVQNWSNYSVLHVTGPAIVPSSLYDVGFSVGENSACAGLQVATTRWGDVEIPYNPPSPTEQPDFDDIRALVDKFRSHPEAITKVRALLAGVDQFGTIDNATLAQDVGFADISAVVDAFRGKPYPYRPGRCSTATSQECGDTSECPEGQSCILVP